MMASSPFMASQPSLAFTVTRQKPELVAPAEPTPREIKYLSDIDDQQGLRFQIPAIQFYRNEPSMSGKDPVQVIRQALAKALVFFYPFAGRLREGAGRKLMVDCTGEGVMFIEADADATLQHFAIGGEVKPPFPCFDQLLYNVPGSTEILNCPLFLIQVTRLRCGGFIFALRMNHTMGDGYGLFHFMNTIAEIARGVETPTFQPVWQREYFSARNPPRITCTHYEYEEEPTDSMVTNIPLDNLVHRSFFFGPKEISALRSSLPPHLRKCSTVEILTALLWRCRTNALGFNPDEEVRVLLLINARFRFKDTPLPSGYTGNAFAYPGAKTTAGKLTKNPLGYAVELVSSIKRCFSEEYMQSVVDLMVLKGRPPFHVAGSFIMSDLTRYKVLDVDYGWGKAVYNGPPHGGATDVPGVATFHVPHKNNKGENGTLIPMCLPAFAMDKFVNELANTFIRAAL
ncbi:benzyl alcohol O-benzoyltransferase-like [Ipomoea triloba]|uniref:benzyl alcohol O-benzoyltransferase-like n=1 Tax=Ipomoea triloba TaxID=35885 RepID=UPI00125E73AD|nr:benzyl alcohol O-benzoyltransferase-like [Ipomoea triloba]